ncbi:MAG: vanadium-dependent haloperoxidase [Myxococcota bacterium]|nr:vanadium-dependent haloperoxidase [Myxococcota bacterium]
MAVVQVAVFEAVNATTGKYSPYYGVTAASGASSEAAAVTAAHGVLKWLFPAAAGTLDARLANSLAAIPDGQAKDDGIAAGQAAASATIADRTGDGSGPPPAGLYTPTSTAPYEWQPTGGCPAGNTAGVFFNWQNVKPFGIESSTQFLADPPPELGSPRYRRDYNEVQEVGSATSTSRPQDRTDAARLYAALPPHIGWNSVARQLAAANDDEITRTARVLALMNMSISDAHVTTFETKYLYRTWRPITAIRRGAEDGDDKTNPDPAWTPLITNPCFPGYTSAHGGGAGAAARVLTRAYGDDGHTITTSHPGAPGIVFVNDSIGDIVDDISDARVYGGIHFRVDQTASERLGKDVAKYNSKNYFRPVDSTDFDSED